MGGLELRLECSGDWERERRRAASGSRRVPFPLLSRSLPLLFLLFFSTSLSGRLPPWSRGPWLRPAAAGLSGLADFLLRSELLDQDRLRGGGPSTGGSLSLDFSSCSCLEEPEVDGGMAGGYGESGRVRGGSSGSALGGSGLGSASSSSSLSDERWTSSGVRSAIGFL